MKITIDQADNLLVYAAAFTGDRVNARVVRNHAGVLLAWAQQAYEGRVGAEANEDWDRRMACMRRVNRIRNEADFQPDDDPGRFVADATQFYSLHCADKDALAGPPEPVEADELLPADDVDLLDLLEIEEE